MRNACMACGRGALEQLSGPPSRWSYWRCADCEHVGLLPPPSSRELHEHYNGAYAVDLAAHLAAAPASAEAVNEILAGMPPGRMLEIGCSYGGVLRIFGSWGWHVTGVEIDERAAQWARRETGLEVHAGTLDDVCDALTPPYDVVACYHVLEHVPEPREFLRQVHEILRPGGLLVIRTPNASSAMARLVKGWWEWCAAPEHVHLFSPESIALVLGQSGFDLTRLLTRRGDAAGTLSELFRAAVRRLLPAVARRGRAVELPATWTSEPDGVGSGPPAVGRARRPRLLALRRTLDAVGHPLDLALVTAGRLGGPGGAELMLAARRAEPHNATVSDPLPTPG